MKNRIAIFLILISTRTFACDCEWAGNFLSMAAGSEVVVLIKVTKYNNFFQFSGGVTSNEHQQPLSATFEIVELIRGDEQRTQIEVFGDPGNLCRPYINFLELGNYYVVALNKSEGVNHGGGIVETPNDYFLWNCGEYWINYNNTKKSANGYILKGKKKKREFQYAELINKLKKEKANNSSYE